VIRRIVLPLFIIGMIFGPLASLGQETNQVLADGQVKNGLVSLFSVIDGKVISKKADQETCETDNVHIRSAFEARGISLAPYDYRVKVSKILSSGPSEKDDEKEVLYRYELEFVDFDYMKKNPLSSMMKNGLLKTYIAATKAPTTCYAFLRGQNLNLLCQYGMQEQRAMKEVIDAMLRKTQ
jgi:hypothetical protein